jgi:hypothetical protein
VTQLCALVGLTIGCRTSSPATVANPLVSGVIESLEAQRTMPQFLIAADSLTALVLTPFAKERGIILARPDSAVHCPWSGRTPTGYGIRISVDSITRSEARGRFELSCSSPALRGRFATGGRARLRRVGNGWVIEKWLDKWIT